MQQTTHEEKSSADASVGGARGSSGAWRRLAMAWAPTALFALFAVFVGADLVSDVADGASTAHVVVEGSLLALSLVGVVYMWRLLRSAQARALDLQRDLDGTRADLARWRAEAQDHLRGLGAAIDRQFERWGLTPAEREVALLLLKGLSLRDVAVVRATSERTVRQQSLAVYRKAGIAGRAELAAFFLEDLLLPGDAAEKRGKSAAV